MTRSLMMFLALGVCMSLAMGLASGCSKGGGHKTPTCSSCETLDEASQTCIWNDVICPRTDGDSDHDSNAEVDTDKVSEDGDGESGAETEAAESDEAETTADGDSDALDWADFDSESAARECSHDSDCRPNETCGTDGFCHVTCECTRDQDCQVGYTCVGGCHCQLIPADSDSEESASECSSEESCSDYSGCAYGVLCNLTTHCCEPGYFPPCTDNNDCPFNQAADTSPTGTYCSSDLHTCTYECLKTSDCVSDYGDNFCCNCRGACVAADMCACPDLESDDSDDLSCTTCADCTSRGAGWYCNSTTGKCTSGGLCCQDSDCTSGENGWCDSTNGTCSYHQTIVSGSISGTVFTPLVSASNNAWVEVLLLDGPSTGSTTRIQYRTGRIYVSANGDYATAAYSFSELPTGTFYVYLGTEISSTMVGAYQNPIQIDTGDPTKLNISNVNMYYGVDNPNGATISGDVTVTPALLDKTVSITLYEIRDGATHSVGGFTLLPDASAALTRPYSFTNLFPSGGSGRYLVSASVNDEYDFYFDSISRLIDVTDLPQHPGMVLSGNELYLGEQSSPLGSVAGNIVLTGGLFPVSCTFSTYLYLNKTDSYPVASGRLIGDIYSSLSYEISNIEGGLSGTRMRYYIRGFANCNGKQIAGTMEDGYDVIDVFEGDDQTNDFTGNDITFTYSSL